MKDISIQYERFCEDLLDDMYQDEEIAQESECDEYDLDLYYESLQRRREII